MTKLEAQIRNNKIMQFRGCATRIKGLIPEDIYSKLSWSDKLLIAEADKVYNRIIQIMNSNIDCKHSYIDSDNICYYCGHKKYSRDGKGKSKTKTFS